MQEINDMNSADQVLSAYEASRMCGLSKESLEKLVKAGKIKGYRMQWRRNAWFWLLKKSSFQRFLKTKYAASICPNPGNAIR